MAGRIRRRVAYHFAPLALSLCAALAVPCQAASGGGTMRWAQDGGGSSPILQGASRGLLTASTGRTFVRPRAAGPFIGGPTRQAAPSLPPLRAGPDEKALIAAPPRDFAGLGALGCIAVSIYHEARDQPAAGQYAVGSVILTRAANQNRWGDTPCAVVQPVQFSYLTADRRFAPISEQAAWERAVRIAAQVLRDGPAPALKGADHYHTTYVSPVWNRQMDAIGRIADHVFWRSRPGPRTRP